MLKMVIYDKICANKHIYFVPFAFETTGGITKYCMKIVDYNGDALADRQQDDREKVLLHQRISISLQRANEYLLTKRLSFADDTVQALDFEFDRTN